MKDLGQAGCWELALDVASPWQHRGSLKLHHAKSFCFPPMLNPVVPWFWTAKAITPGWSSTEFCPHSMPGKGGAALWHLWGDGDAGLGLALQLPVISPSPRCRSWCWTSSRDRAEGNSFQLLEVRASLCFWGPRGGFFCLQVKRGCL